MWSWNQSEKKNIRTGLFTLFSYFLRSYGVFICIMKVVFIFNSGTEVNSIFEVYSKQEQSKEWHKCINDAS